MEAIEEVKSEKIIITSFNDCAHHIVEIYDALNDSDELEVIDFVNDPHGLIRESLPNLSNKISEEFFSVIKELQWFDELPENCTFELLFEKIKKFITAHLGEGREGSVAEWNEKLDSLFKKEGSLDKDIRHLMGLNGKNYKSGIIYEKIIGALLHYVVGRAFEETIYSEDHRLLKKIASEMETCQTGQLEDISSGIIAYLFYCKLQQAVDNKIDVEVDDNEQKNKLKKLIIHFFISVKRKQNKFQEITKNLSGSADGLIKDFSEIHNFYLGLNQTLESVLITKHDNEVANSDNFQLFLLYIQKANNFPAKFNTWFYLMQKEFKKSENGIETALYLECGKKKQINVYSIICQIANDMVNSKDIKEKNPMMESDINYDDEDINKSKGGASGHVVSPLRIRKKQKEVNVEEKTWLQCHRDKLILAGSILLIIVGAILIATGVGAPLGFLFKAYGIAMLAPWLKGIIAAAFMMLTAVSTWATIKYWNAVKQFAKNHPLITLVAVAVLTGITLGVALKAIAGISIIVKIGVLLKIGWLKMFGSAVSHLPGSATAPTVEGIFSGSSTGIIAGLVSGFSLMASKIRNCFHPQPAFAQPNIRIEKINPAAKDDSTHGILSALRKAPFFNNSFSFSKVFNCFGCLGKSSNKEVEQINQPNVNLASPVKTQNPEIGSDNNNEKEGAEEGEEWKIVSLSSSNGSNP